MLAVLQPHSPLAGLVPSLQAIVAHESGLDVPAAVLLEKCVFICIYTIYECPALII